ncbi:MAG: arginine deiminase family protein, partial [Bacteroidota bacterium]
MKPRITSEFTPLKKVLVHTPGPEHGQMIPWEGDHPMMGLYPRMFEELQKNHQDLKQIIADEIGAENVYELRHMLEEIFEQADGRMRERILKDTLHRTADHYIDDLMAHNKRLDSYPTRDLVSDLIEGYPRRLILNNNRLPNIIVPPKRELMWVRDSSAATPAGVMITALASSRRNLEPALLRTLFKYHPMFDQDSIFLDMVGFLREMQEDNTWSGLRDHFLMEGGNVLVLSEDTLAVGVGRKEFLYSNRTTRAAFELMVKKLFEADTEKKIQRIYLVNVPDLRGFIHLDTVFNMFGPKSAIVMPYIFGYPHANTGENATEVLQHFVDWLRKNMGGNLSDLRKIPTRAHFEHA